MTEADKTQIIKLRAKGCSYKKISAETGISENSIKSFFKRNKDFCPVCGIPLIGKKYCSDKCRISWWNKHPHRTSAMIECKCETCKKTFFAYPSKARKYCSKKCYGKSCRKENRNDK